jgi:hypothetical protein
MESGSVSSPAENFSLVHGSSARPQRPVLKQLVFVQGARRDDPAPAREDSRQAAADKRSTTPLFSAVDRPMSFSWHRRTVVLLSLHRSTVALLSLHRSTVAPPFYCRSTVLLSLHRRLRRSPRDSPPAPRGPGRARRRARRCRLATRAATSSTLKKPGQLVPSMSRQADSVTAAVPERLKNCAACCRGRRITFVRMVWAPFCRRTATRRRS